MTEQNPLQALQDFWFHEDNKPFWFKQDDAFDATLKQRFAGLLDDADTIEMALGDTSLLLATILLFDQVPRNVFRGTANAFAFDERARKLARRIVNEKRDASMNEDQQLFTYMPFQHSEDLEDQQLAIRLYGRMENDFYLGFAKQHLEIIERFGRFPYRNKVLGRTSTEDEIRYLENEMPKFGASA